MRRFQCALLAAVAIFGFASVASAADMPMKAVPAPVAAPVYNWTGCYIGAHAGYGWGRKDMNPDNIYGNGFWESAFNVDGWLAGGQLGCNYQFPSSNWVVGIDGSISATDIRGSGLDGYVPGGPFYDTAKVKDLGSITGRIGWNGWNPQHLLYVKGGWAWAKDDFVNSFPEAIPYTANQDRTGWTVGAGWEWAFAPRWSAFLEYDHYDFGTKNVVDNYGDDPFAIKQTIETVKVGVNFRLVP